LGKSAKNDLHLYIIKHIKEHNKLPSNDRFNGSKYNKQYYITALKKLNIIAKTGYATWHINPQNLHKLGLAKGSTYTSKGTPQGSTYTSLPIRAHGFQFSLKIPYYPKWHKIIRFLDKKKIKYDLIGIRKNTPRINIKDFKIWLGKRSITIYSPKGKSYYAENAIEGQKAALDDLYNILIKLQRLLNINLKMNNEYCVEITKHHYSNIDNEIAKDYNKRNKKLQIYKENRVWLIIDDSHNLKELETTHKQTAATDMDNILMPFFNSMKDYYEKTGTIITPFNIMDMFLPVVQNQTFLMDQHKLYAENIALHISSIKQLANASTRQTQILEKLELLLAGKWKG